MSPKEKSYRDFFYNLCESQNISLPNPDIWEKIQDYLDLLLEANKSINLIGANDPYNIISRHIVDCLVITKFLNDSDYILDIGTGAGLPSIVLKIWNPSLNILALESKGKKARFVERVIRSLKLKGIYVLQSRMEEIYKKAEFQNQFSVAVTRAVGPLEKIVKYIFPVLQINGRLIAFAGESILNKKEVVFEVIKMYGGKNIEVKEYSILDNRGVIIIAKKHENIQKHQHQ